MNLAIKSFTQKWRKHCFISFPKSGVKTEEIRKGRILVVLRVMWRVFLEILPLQEESNEKHIKNIKKQ